MAMVEIIRLVIILSFTAAGYKLGSLAPERFNLGSLTPDATLLIFTTVGAGLGYVAGGMLGRSILSAIGAVERRVERVSGGEIVAGAIGLVIGSLAAVMSAWPLVTFIPIEMISFPLVALIFIVFGYAGYRIAARKRFDLLSMMGLSQFRTFRDDSQQVAVGARILDASAIIDGRIVEVARSGFLSGHVICPQFVLAEIQSIADSNDALRRARGRRGLETLDVLQSDPRIRLDVTDDHVPEFSDVDAKLVAYAKRIGGVLVTTDFNLHRVAELQGVPVLNLNMLAASLRPALIPGEEVTVRIIRPGSHKGQGVGYLEDGTMIVVEGGSEHIGDELTATVTSILQTAAGRMLFAVPSEQQARAE